MNLFVLFMCLIAAFSGIEADDDSHTRHIRASLGLTLDHGFCQHLGRSCGVIRDKTDKPTAVTVIPCCKYLQCTGVSPNVNSVPSSIPELIVSNLNNRPADYTVYTGMCTLGLDNNEAYTNFDAYKSYVKGLDSIP